MLMRFGSFIETYRLISGPLASPPLARYGAFLVTCPSTKELLKIIVASGESYAAHEEGEPFDHVSVSCEHRCPTWDEMCWVKSLFFADDECVMQLHPPKSDYINNNPNVLHLWKPLRLSIPMPPKHCV